MSSWPSEFPLLERLNRVSPIHALPDRCRAYRLEDADPGSINRYLHFAASVAWRAGSTDWSKARVRLPRCTLGPYEGALRDYLLELKGLDAKVFVMMWVIESDLRLTVILPQSERMGSPAYFRHMFCIPGLLFQLFVGGDVPASIRAGALNTGGIVLVGGFEQAKLAQNLVGAVRLAKPAGKLERERAQNKSEPT